MPFHVSEKTLERLEWSRVAERLQAHARTPQGRARLGGPAADLFESGLHGMRARLAETSEARAILDGGNLPPLGDVSELGPLLPRLRKEGILTGSELLRVGGTLRASANTRRFLVARSEAAPGLAELAEGLSDHSQVASEIERCLDPEGEVLDAASRELAAARRESREIAGQVKTRISRYLRDAEIGSALQDSYVTVRSDRYVLPVRADARGRVPGIVHDASSSGTTLFIEPQAVVDLNNRLKQAELTVERETRRVLTLLSQQASMVCAELEANLVLLEQIDLAFARGALSAEQHATPPVIDESGVFAVHQLRHPLLPPREAVPNDLQLGEGFHVLVISGPNAGGKTVAMKALALLPLFTRAGLHVPADPGARVSAVESVLADIGDEQDMRESLSTFSAHMANLSDIVGRADAKSLVVLDEVGVGTDPGEGAALAQATLETLADAGARVVTTTHYNLLKEMAAVDDRFANASVEFDPETLEPTYRLKHGAAGSSSATAVAARMGMPTTVLERANTLLEREDRRLDRMLSELAASRATLERERSEATRLRQEGEVARNEYRNKLERLQERRDKLFAEMREDLDAAFKDAHAEVAGVIRGLQRGGRAQDAAQARDRLLALEKKARHAEEASAAQAPAPPREPVDWHRARAGDTVGVPGGRTGSLVSLPDRRGRVRVQVAGARLTLTADQVTPAAAGTKSTPAARPVPQAPLPPAGSLSLRVDVRGERALEAVDRVDKSLDEAANQGAPWIEIVHGIGTGALRRAIREHLRVSPLVTRFEPAPAEAGGEGVTLAYLEA